MCSNSDSSVSLHILVKDSMCCVVCEAWSTHMDNVSVCVYVGVDLSMSSSSALSCFCF